MSTETKNSKNRLQEYCQKNGYELPTYTHTGHTVHLEKGSQLQWTSTVCCLLPGGVPLTKTSGLAPRKIDADQEASFLMLQTIQPPGPREAIRDTPSPMCSRDVSRAGSRVVSRMASRGPSPGPSCTRHVIVDYENIGRLESLPGLVATMPNTRLHVVVGYCNQKVDDPLVTHIIRSAGTDAADHAITYLCGLIAASSPDDCCIYVVTRDKFGAHLEQVSKLQIDDQPKRNVWISHCTNERECVSLLRC